MADVDIHTGANSLTNNRDALWGPYWTSPTTGYVVLQVGSSSVIEVLKTTDSGASWTIQDSANNPAGTTNRSMAVWWDRETPDDTGTLIHIAWVQTTDNEVHYINFNTSTDAFGTNRTVDALTVSSTSNDTDVGITVAKSGRVYVCASGDLDLSTEGTDHSMLFSDDNGANWTDATSPYSTDEEQVRLFPGAETDQDDIYAVVFDSIQLDLEFWKYDASAASWAVTQIDDAIAITQLQGRTIKRFFDGAVRHSDGHILVAYWNAQDLVTADFRCVDITGTTPTVTQKTNIDTDTDDSGIAALLINQQNDDVYVAYVGKDDGSEAFLATVACFFKKSTDDMGNWGAEQTYGIEADDLRCASLGRTVGNDGGRVMPAWFNDDTTDITVNDGNDIEIAASVGGQTLSPSGIASLEAFGAAVVAGPVSPGAIASAEAFGNAQLNLTFTATGIASLEAFGGATVTLVAITLSPSGIASLEAFGSAVLTTTVSISAGGIASAEAFGSAQLNLAFTATGIPSAEAFGAATISTSVTITASGIASLEAFGSAQLDLAFTATGIPTAEAFGAANVTLAGITLSPSGIPSAEAFGAAQLNLAFTASGIASLEGFGAATVTVVAVPVVIELAASYTPIITLAASDIPVIDLAASYTPIIELEAVQS